MTMKNKMKVCTECKIKKNIREFNKHKTGRFGARTKCKACSNARQRMYDKSHRAERIERDKKNNVEISAYNIKYYAENIEKEAARGKKYYEENKEKESNRNKRWSKANPDKVTARGAVYRTRKSGNGGSFTAKEWEALCNKYDNKCLCCGKKKKLHADHVVPVSKGGTSFISNIQPLCKSCNSSKGNRSSKDYRRMK